MYEDDESADESVSFQIVAPSSINYTFDSDIPSWTPWSSGPRFFAADAKFWLQVSPLSVSFSNIKIQENFGSGFSGLWPNTATPPGFAGWSSQTGIRGPVSLDANNKHDDYHDLGPEREDALDNTAPYTDYSGYTSVSFGFNIPIEYETDSGYVQFATPYADRNVQTNIKAKVKIGNSSWSGLQGPWATP